MNDTSDFIKKIRQDISVLVKKVDEFAVQVENQIKGRENELTEMMKKYQTLKEKEKELIKREDGLKTKEKEISKQKQANADKELALNKKESDLESKLQRVQSILN